MVAMVRFTYRILFLFFTCILFAALSTNAQTINAPVLHCVSFVPGQNNNLYVRLVWSLPVNGCGPFNAYNIYRSTDLNGPYTLVYSESNQLTTSYEDTVPDQNLVYFYYMESDFDCAGFIKLHSDTLDSNDPETPVFNYVTVANNAAVLNWQPSTSPETYGYIIYKYLNGNVNYDTIYGKNNTTYTDVGAPVNSDTASYTLSAFDSCYNTGPIIDLPQHTIYLTQDVDRCNNTITLNWYPYSHWDPGVMQYDVYVSSNGGIYNLVQTLPPNQLTYQITGLDDGDNICIKVVATQTTTMLTSTSNELCSKLNIVQPSSELYIRNVSVAADGQVNIYYSVDPLADLASIKIQRGLDSTSFEQIASITPPADLSVINVFEDTTALTSQLSYYYRVVVSDSCGNSDTSSIGKSILLSGYAFSNLSIFVKWDAAYLQYGTVTGYGLHRDDGAGFSTIALNEPDVREFNEGNIPSPKPCYYVDAIDSMIFPNGTVDTVHSRSNVLCLNQPNQIYMPNAFAPQGSNNIFKPILNVESISSFTFTVFNRWGKEIFTSLDPDLGWDGRDNGNLVPQGAYAYQVVVVDGNKKHITAKGTVLVVR